MTLREWLAVASQKLEYRECIYLVRAVFGQEILDLSQEIKEIPLLLLEKNLQMRIEHKPLSKIMHKKHFLNHLFITTDDTLDPRPETESLIEYIKTDARKILELGIGSGCILISILKKYPKAKGVGVDISSEALEVAAMNAKILGVEKRIELRLGNWANDLTGDFDYVIANPPYVSADFEFSDSLKYDPKIALIGDISTYKNLLNSLSEVKFKTLLLEVPENLQIAVQDLLKQGNYNFSNIESTRVYNTDIFIIKALKREYN